MANAYSMIGWCWYKSFELLAVLVAFMTRNPVEELPTFPTLPPAVYVEGVQI